MFWKMQRRRKPILCLDFDGVIHSYSSGWKGARVIPDAPVAGVGAFLLDAMQHWRVTILSSRSHQWGGRRAMRRYVREIVRDACFADSEAMHKAWSATQGKPAEWIPWTAGDVNEAADWIASKIGYPLFKPPAVITIDDRALTFSGNWSDYNPQHLRGFQPWNKRRGTLQSNGKTEGESQNVSQIRPTHPVLT